MSNTTKKRTSIDDKLYRLRRDIRDEFKLLVDSTKSDVQNQYKLDKEALKRQNRKNATIILSVLAFLGLTSIGGINFAYKQASSRITKALDVEVARVQQKVTERLDEEFRTENVRVLIEEAAKKYTKNEAQTYIAERLEEEINPVKESLNRKLAEFDNVLEYINRIIEVYELETSARNGSRSSFEKLQAMTTEEGSIGASALNRIIAIKNIYGILRNPLIIMLGGLSVSNKQGKTINYEDLSTLEELPQQICVPVLQ